MSATEGQRIYAIGDIHGRRDLLEAMLARIEADLVARPHRRARIVFVGDYVDRGPDSSGVIARLVKLRAARLPTTFLLGNHDNYILTYLEDPQWQDRTYHWLHSALGGAETLASYGVMGARDTRPEATRDAFAAAFPAAHLAFLERCELMYRVGGYLFVHAGIRPGVPLDKQQREDLIWIRDPFLNATQDHGAKVVHGHTIVPKVEHHPNRIAIDTGAVRSGILSCLLLEDDDVALLEENGPVALPEGGGASGGLFSGLRAFWPGR